VLGSPDAAAALRDAGPRLFPLCGQLPRRNSLSDLSSAGDDPGDSASSAGGGGSRRSSRSPPPRGRAPLLPRRSRRLSTDLGYACAPLLDPPAGACVPRSGSCPRLPT
jgi:hypothetical protein